MSSQGYTKQLCFHLDPCKLTNNCSRHQTAPGCTKSHGTLQKLRRYPKLVGVQCLSAGCALVPHYS